MSLHSRHHYTVTPLTTPPHSHPPHDTTSQSTHSQHHYTVNPSRHQCSQALSNCILSCLNEAVFASEGEKFVDGNSDAWLLYTITAAFLPPSRPVHPLTPLTFPPHSLKKGGMGEEVRSHRVEEGKRTFYSIS
ncbi:hypothetical protein Pcinc_044451 [Petrolisthes cinctipes]|uniref:Uncharacterized protein n=1 Tax=Petrolisthes cinctipes TaxID=88211 RepID=A0AAE1EEC7_PETCI|nr:hypothetical protein Pcinc_044451 [Petrolisthes cinctipes]